MASLDLNRATHHPHCHHITILQSPRPSPASRQRLTNGPCHAARRLRLFLSVCLQTCSLLELDLGGFLCGRCLVPKYLRTGIGGLTRSSACRLEAKKRRKQETERQREMPAHCTYRACQYWKRLQQAVCQGGASSTPWDPWMSFIDLGSTAQPQRQASSRRSTAHVTGIARASGNPRFFPEAPCRASTAPRSAPCKNARMGCRD
ncbi:hypothetical protein J3F84DRAFT_359447 [Trichoderma pleuroticola]